MMRKRGAEMSAGLIWAAFALLVLVGIIYLSGTIEIKRVQSQATTVMSSVSTELRAMHAVQGHYDWLSDRYVAESGAISPRYVVGTGEDTQIIFDKQASMNFFPTASPREFQLNITWPQSGRLPLAVCQHLASVIEGRQSSGTLGEEYEVIFSACDAPTPTLSVVYYN